MKQFRVNRDFKNGCGSKRVLRSLTTIVVMVFFWKMNTATILKTRAKLRVYLELGPNIKMNELNMLSIP